MEVVSRVSRQGAADSGLREGTPVIAGTTDTVAEVFGSGLLRSGQGMVKLASVGRLAVVAESPLRNPRILNYRHIMPGLWYPGSGTKSAAASPRWLRDDLWGDQSFEQIDAAASRLPPGSGGLIFHPHLHGEWAPHWNEELRANFVGATVRHGRAHFSRAVLEGVAFNMKLIEQAFQEQGIKPAEIRMIGGGAKSRLWRGIFADVMEKPVARLSFIEEATSVGAAIAGGVGVGIFSSINDAARIVKQVETNRPIEQNFPVYRKQFEIFKRSYEQLEGVFDLLVSGSD